ncbi:MAG: hypothetical protein ABI295_10885 [Xanthomarina sp.]
MHKKLLIKCFDKARKELQRQGTQNPSTVKIAELLSNYVDENEGFPLGERTYRDYYNHALKDDVEDIEIRQIKVLNGLCRYLGFEDYSDFTTELNENKTIFQTPKMTSFLKKHKIALLILLALIIAFTTLNSLNKQKWMHWENDRYIEADFDAKLLKDGFLKIYNIDRIENLRKITPDCNTAFFKENKTENVWYGKNKNGDLEFFTSIGLHPETGKTLKKITKHMITKYVCATY